MGVTIEPAMSTTTKNRLIKMTRPFFQNIQQANDEGLKARQNYIGRKKKTKRKRSVQKKSKVLDRYGMSD